MALTQQDFLDSLTRDAPPETAGDALRALWWGKKAQWERAHALVQDSAGTEAARVHAWLHRWEGDTGNAAYWYRRAGCDVADDSLDEEWQLLVAALTER
ncbi:hypothetical protein [Kushneria aurantia]|uniref:Uncharacterized protein n=1 Tax=Kushneria aurantia TaxID=504092 RepID=A0ABV6G1T7_9GAMM|nr:hypothetical protein [Kushneria aurantia]